MRDEPPRAASCSPRQAFAAHLAQHVELALAHEVVAPLALDHRLELALGVARSRARRPGAIEVGPVRGRVGHELAPPCERSSSCLWVPSWSAWSDVARLAVGAAQSPNIFCFSSRRCCASSDSVAVGRASRRPRPIGSPVSSQ